MREVVPETHLRLLSPADPAPPEVKPDFRSFTLKFPWIQVGGEGE